jgi:hypothetical protein
MEPYNAPQERDPELWELARKRASFQGHLRAYVVVNTFFWILWYFNGRNYSNDGVPWPIWPALGWGIGITMHYFRAYVYPKSGSVEREYEKLKQQQTK